MITYPAPLATGDSASPPFEESNILYNFGDSLVLAVCSRSRSLRSLAKVNQDTESGRLIQTSHGTRLCIVSHFATVATGKSENTPDEWIPQVPSEPLIART